jgi:hypothetical protein
VDPEIIEVASIFAILTGVTWMVKLIFLGRGPIRRRPDPAQNEAMEQRIAEVEDRIEQHLAAMNESHRDQLLELEDRLDFAERLLAQQKDRGGLPPPPPPPPPRNEGVVTSR